MLLSLLLLACTGPDVVDSGVADSGDTNSDDTNLPDGLNGTAPASPVPLPSFAARNQDGEARSAVDLVGHPTVLWFYPAAGTAG